MATFQCVVHPGGGLNSLGHTDERLLSWPRSLSTEIKDATHRGDEKVTVVVVVRLPEGCTRTYII